MNSFYPNYHELRKANPEFARKCILEAYRKTRNISEVSRMFDNKRKTIRKVLKKYEQHGHLNDDSKNLPNKTPPHIE